MRKTAIDERLIIVYNIVGINIARLRGKMGQDKLAEKAGLSRQTISAIENSQAISLESLIKIADALEVELADLFITDEKRGEVSYIHVMLMEKMAESFGIKPPKKNKS